jgi:hypothetical protein
MSVSNAVQRHLQPVYSFNCALITEKGDLGLAQTLHVSSRPPWVPCDLWKTFDGPNGVVIDARSARPGFQSKVRTNFSHDRECQVAS